MVSRRKFLKGSMMSLLALPAAVLAYKALPDKPEVPVDPKVPVEPADDIEVLFTVDRLHQGDLVGKLGSYVFLATAQNRVPIYGVVCEHAYPHSYVKINSNPHSVFICHASAIDQGEQV